MEQNTGRPKQMTEQEVIENWAKELTNYLLQMTKFRDLSASEILQNISAWSARAYYIRSKLVRSSHPKAKTLKTQEVDPFIQACDTQFKVWSRHQSIIREEWEMSTK